MAEVLVGLIITVLAIAIVTGLLQKRFADRRRREQLMMLAMSLGMDFEIEDKSNIRNRCPHFGCLDQGHNQYAYNVISGEAAGFRITGFDYVYHTTEPTDRGTIEVGRHFSAILFEAKMKFHPLLICPENLFDGIAGEVVFEDISFESEEFTSRFGVKSGDEKFARDLIHPKMMEFLIQNRGWHICLGSNSAMIYTGKLLSADEFKAGMLFLLEFFDLFPEHLWQESGVGT